MKKTTYKAIYTVLICLFLTGCQFNDTNVSANSASKESSTADSEHLKYGIPSANGKLLYRTGYVALYDKEKKDPLWVSYHLTAGELNTPQLKRSNKFAPDPDLAIGERAELYDYRNSGYDRGHMCPNADQAWSALTMKECFFLSNMCPQIHALNAGEWEQLESKVRDFTKKHGEVWIICGPVFNEPVKDGRTAEVKTIGSNKVWVPTDFYKIVAYENNVNKVEAVGFKMAQANLRGNLSSYVVKIRDIESLTGLDFFNKLPKTEDDRVETNRNITGEFWNN